MQEISFLKPLLDHAIIRVDHDEALGKSGLIWFTPRRYIGQPGQYAILRATVEAVGPGKKIRGGGRGPMDLKVGDVIYVGRFAGLDLEDFEDVRLIRQNEALLIVEV
jgi:co-chaperonin GroES (HSP10)